MDDWVDPRQSYRGRQSLYREQYNALGKRNLAAIETCRAKGYTMQVPSILQADSLKRLLQGATVGAVATMVVGFSWGGWSLGSTADKMERAV